MEKIKESYSKEYPVLRLFKQDIEQIVNLFKENYEKFDIIADGYKLDDISEITKIKKQEIVDFEIVAQGPYLSLNLSRDSARLYIADKDDIKLLGLAAKIDTILSKRKRPLRFFTSNLMPISLNLTLLLTILFFPLKQYKMQVLILLISTILLYVLWFILNFSSLKKHSLIYLYDSSSTMGFFKRNKDSIFLAIFSAVIGGIITLVIGLLMKLI